MNGQITKGIGGFYYVNCDNVEYVLKAPGKFRNDGIKPIVGDEVEFDKKGGYIEKILPRKNEFYRPAVANVTQTFIVFTASQPKVDLILIDKLIIQSEMSGVNIVLVINKSDTMCKGDVDMITSQYSDFDILYCCAKNNEGIDNIKKRIKDNVSFFAGQSGVGKSSIINCISSRLSHETGEMSKKLCRGKHTTRHVELVYLPELGGSILDTPGFSFYNLKNTDFAIEEGYREFEPYRKKCRFVGCTHINEPDCAVKEHIGKGINLERYDRYKHIHLEQKETRDRQYD